MKRREKRGTVVRLAGYMRGCRAEAVVAVLLAVTSNLPALAGPLLMGQAVDAMHGAGDVEFVSVGYYCILMAGFYVLSTVLVYALSAVMIKISREISCRIRNEAFDRLLRLPAGYSDAREIGDIISCLSYDINVIHDTLASDLLVIVTSFFTVIISLYMMLVISVEMMLVFTVTVPAVIWATRRIASGSRRLFEEKSRQLGSLNGTAQECADGMKTIQAYGQQERVCGEFRRKNRSATDACYNAQCCSSLSGPTVNFINNSSLAAISMLGAVFYLSGRMSLGAISSFVLYSRKFSGPISEIAGNFSELQAAVAAARRVFSLLDQEDEQSIWERAGRLYWGQGMSMEEKQRKGQEQDACRNSRGVVLSHISFGYTPGVPVLRDVSFTAGPGTVTAVVGPTGSGKTTLIHLIMGFYSCSGGTILVEGDDIRTLGLEILRKRCDMILQDSWIFRGTVHENIAYGRSGASRQEVEKAARRAQIHDYIQSLPDGYDTLIGDGILNLSRGQKQMIAIARAMLSQARILIFDEATSDVDTRTEKQIQAALDQLAAGKTCIMIAHRLSSVRNADQIIVLKEGTVVQKGTHRQLMAEPGLYRQMYRAQFCAGPERGSADR